MRSDLHKNGHVHFEVLGPLRVSDGDREIDIARPKERGVLAALLVEANSVVPLDRLVNLMWGDEPPARAVGTLHAYISNLRRLLEPDRPARAPSTVLVSRPPGYSLVAGPGDIDSVVFERLAAVGRAALVEGDAVAALEACDAALRLWRGPAYADFVYDDFTAAARRRLEELRLVAVEDRTDALLALGRHDEAVAHLEGQLVDEPLRERMWQQLVVALYRSGRQADALGAVRRARAALDDLGLEPGSGLRDLEQAVLRQSATLDLPARAARVVVSVSDVVPDEDPTAPVGRADELATVESALAEVRRGSGRVLLLTGDAGIGKSAIAAHLLRRAEAAGAATAVARCPESDAPVLWPWVQLVRQLAGGEVPDELAPLLASDPDGEAPLTASLIHQVESFLRLQASVAPVVLLIEDAQWADEGSQRLLQLVLDDLADVSVLVVITVRTPAASSESLNALVATARDRAGSIGLALSPLSPEGTAQLVAAVAGAQVDAEVGTAMHARTAGNPLFVVELTRLLMAEQRLYADAIASAAVPSTVRDVVRRRLQRLPEQANAVLSVAAVVGPEVDVRRVAAVTDLDEDEVVDLFELAAVAGVLAERPDRPGVYRFAHDIVRESILDGLPGTRRARLHQRVLDATIALQGDNRSTAHEIARHAVGAVAVSGALPAVERLMASARVAHGDLAIALAERQVRLAEELLDQVPPSRERDRFEVQVQSRLGQLLVHSSGDLAEANRRQLHALRLCPDEEVDLLCGVLLNTGCYSPLAGDFAAGVAAGERLLRVARKDSLAWQAAAHYVLSMAVWQGDVQSALAHADSAVDAAARADSAEPWTGVPAPVMAAHRALVLSLAGRSDWRAQIRASIDASVRAHEDWTLCWSGAFGVVAAFASDDPTTCLEIAEAAETAIATLGYTAPVLAAGVAWAKGGDPDDIAAAAAQLAAMHDGMFRGPVLTMLAATRAATGDAAGARAAIDEAEQVVMRVGALGWLPVVHRVRSAVATTAEQ